MATYCEYDIFDMDDLIQQIMLSVQSKEEALATVNQLIMEKKEHWDLYKLVIRKIESNCSCHSPTIPSSPALSAITIPSFSIPIAFS